MLKPALPPISFRPTQSASSSLETPVELDVRETIKRFTTVPSTTPRRRPRLPSPSICACRLELSRLHGHRTDPPDTPLCQLRPLSPSLKCPSPTTRRPLLAQGPTWTSVARKMAKRLPPENRYTVLMLAPLEQLQLKNNCTSPPERLGSLLILGPPSGLPLLN